MTIYLENRYRMILVFLMLIGVGSLCLNAQYNTIDGDNCSAGGTSPEWTSPNFADPSGDSNAGGTDLVGFWYDFNLTTYEFCFAFERESSNTPSATYVIFFDLDCDETTGWQDDEYTGGETAIGLEWLQNGPWNVIQYVYPVCNNNITLGQAFVGEAVCGDTNTEGEFAEFCFDLSDLINNGGYDPCICNVIAPVGVISLAGGNICSQDKDFIDGYIAPEIELNDPPVAVASVTPDELCLGNSISFNGSGSYDPDGGSLTYCWDFDYGGAGLNCQSTSVSGTHTFTSTGWYTVALEVSEIFYGVECTDTTTVDILVYDEPIAAFNIVFDPCNFTVQFDAGPSIDNTLTDNLIYSWDFGDGNSASFESGSHTYASCGDFDITLTVTDPDANPPCNDDQITQSISFETEDPSLTCPAPTNHCELTDYPAFTTYNEFTAGGGSATDNCTIIESSFVLQSETSDNNSCPETITRVYYIEDQCGNSTTCTETFTIDDSTPPGLVCPAGIATQCAITDVPPYADLAEFVADGGFALDNCEIDVNSFALTSEVSNGSSCPEIITRTYEIADICGNLSYCTQSITINDIIPPTITCPPSVSTQCAVTCATACCCKFSICIVDRIFRCYTNSCYSWRTSNRSRRIIVDDNGLSASRCIAA